MNKSLLTVLNLEPINTKDNQYSGEYKEESINQVEDDFEYARKNLYSILEKSQSSMDEMMDVARQSQHPRAYEVMNQMFKTVADISKDLIDLQKKKKDVIGPSESTPQTVHNNLFVGTTADLSKMIEDARNKGE